MDADGHYLEPPMVLPEYIDPKFKGRAPVNHIVDMMHMLTGLIAGGKLEQFLGLRLAVLESSGGWLVSYLERMHGPSLRAPGPHGAGDEDDPYGILPAPVLDLLRSGGSRATLDGGVARGGQHILGI